MSTTCSRTKTTQNPAKFTVSRLPLVQWWPWYAPLAEFAGCGATVPLLGFGHLLAKGVRTALEEEGAVGILTGGITAAAAGITTSLVCGVVCSCVGKSHDQN